MSNLVLRQIISRGFMTYALTDGQDVLDICKSESVVVNNFDAYRDNLFLSKVYKSVYNDYYIIDKGENLAECDNSRLFVLLKQSQLNLSPRKHGGAYSCYIDARRNIKTLLRLRKMTIYRLAKLSGVDEAFIRRIINNKSDCTITTYNKLIKALYDYNK